MDNPFESAQGKAEIARRLPDVDEATVGDYIADAWARALSVAPCLGLDSFPPVEKQVEKTAQVKAIMRAVILRWHEAQAGGVTGKTQMAGPYQQSVQLDARPKRGFNLLPAEIVDFQRLCEKKGRPFSIDTIPDEVSNDIPLYGVVVNGSTEGLHGPPGEWSEDRAVVDP